jgi:RNA polymerase sigma-70 factor (ECF subfamily)
MMWSASDDGLLAGYATGDADAAAAFIRRHQRRVYGLAQSIVGDRAMAEDVAQEAFLRAWRHASAYDPRRASVSTWLLTITRNLAIDAIRLRRAQPVDPELFAKLDAAARGLEAHPDAAIVAKDEAAVLRSAMERLPQEQRRALVLAGLGGRTAREVSEAENIPLGTAKTRIRSGMLKLREALASEIGAGWPEIEGG